MSKFLIVNSDDFGMSSGVNRGIIEGHQQGIVTSTTVMVNMPAAVEGISTAIRTAPKLGLGLHFNLSFGSPVAPPESVPSLVTAEGHFVSSYNDLMNKLASFTTQDLERELTAQFQRFIELAGRIPDHLDSHHGSTYMHPAAFEIMLRMAKTHDLPIRWQGADHPMLEKHGQPRKTDHFLNFIFNFESADRLAPLQAGLRTVQPGYSELMVHVGYGEDLAEAYTFQREEELAAITHPSVKAILAEEGIQLVTFADLP